jgi:protein gp37
MSKNSKIEWTDHTFNPWEGCTKVGPGCDHCYAEVRNARYAGGQSINWGPGVPRRRTSQSNWNKPLKWNKEADAFFAEHGRRQRVFCASLADVFDNEVDPQWRHDLFALIEATPNLDWLLLTKRIGNVNKLVDRSAFEACPNIWLGATIVNQVEADRDIPKLLDIPVKIRFLSMEPLLEAVSLRWLAGWPQNEPTIAQNPSGYTDQYDGLRQLDWVIVGGESGPEARPMHPDWARSLRDQCEAAGVPYLFKQWGEWCPRGPESLGYPSVEGVPRLRMTDAGHDGQDLNSSGNNDVWMNRAGKKEAGRMLDGITHDGYPL